MLNNGERDMDLNLTKSNIALKRLKLGEDFGNQYLTKREIDILKFVVLGYTTKKIGSALNISVRTVETYIEGLKVKFSCGSKGNIIEVVLKSDLIRHLGILS